MTVIVDTGVLYADHDEDAARHDSAAAGLDAVFDGTYGQPYVSDYIVDEALTLTRARSDRIEPVASLVNKLTGRDPYPTVYDVLFVSRDGFFESLETFHQYADQGLSFTDATIVTLAEQHDIDAVMSFDEGFDGVIDRIDPEQA